MMDGLQFQSFWHLLLLTSYLNHIHASADSPLHLQNVYPGCKDSQNQPLPQCNRSHLLQGDVENPEFAKHDVNSTRMYDCFANNGTLTVQALEGSVRFSGNTPHDDQYDVKVVHCSLTINGPEDTYFQVELNEARSDLSTFVVITHHGSSRTVLGVNETKSTPGNHLLLSIKVTKAVREDFLLRFRAVPECHRQLQVRCFSQISGYIDTPGWSTGQKYINDAHSCVTLHVPPGDVIMVSVVSLELEKTDHVNSTCLDTLGLYLTENCTGPEYTPVCLPGDLLPQLLPQARVVSFRFDSNSHDVYMSGFRLLFSFHGADELPQRIPGDQALWNCSVPFYSSFSLHFDCLAEPFCSDPRSLALCPVHEACGVKVMMLAGRCFQVFQPQELITWRDASNSCRQRGGRLAVLKEPGMMDDAIKHPAVTGAGDNVMFMGLRTTTSVISTDMYKDTMLWSDNTLTLYLPPPTARRQDEEDPPYCLALRKSRLALVSCDTKRRASFLCQDTTQLDTVNTTTATAVSLHASPGQFGNGMSICDDGHVTHTFLACDVPAQCMAATFQESVSCSSKEFSPPVPFFACRNSLERVPYNLVCDFTPHCCDGSDEDFCVYTPCDTETEYECNNQKQCIDKSLKCDERSDCVDGSDEVMCPDVSELLGPPNILPPALVNFTGRGSFTVRNATSCPATHFRCPGDGFCLPVYVRCNGISDCPQHEDEQGCDDFQCRGFYRCRGSRVCLHSQQMCDGVYHCPQHDDEMACDVQCPDDCVCYGLAFVCDYDAELSTDVLHPELRYLDVQGRFRVDGGQLSSFVKLVYLNLSHCDTADFQDLTLRNLQFLGLGENCTNSLNVSWLAKLDNLLSLNISFSNRHPVFSKEINLTSILNLRIYETYVHILNDSHFLERFPNVQSLSVIRSSRQKLPTTGFQSLKFLRVLHVMHVDLQERILPSVYSGLDHLHSVHTNNYKLCCPVVLPVTMNSENCHADQDELSSCDALLRAHVFRVFLTLYASLALMGNAGVFVYRVFIVKSEASTGYEVFVTHLSVADFLMGVYLAIIGIADMLFKGSYPWKDVQWKHSTVCKLAGFLSLLSSEVSVFLVCLITLERFLVLRFPLRNLRFSSRVAHAASVMMWVIGLTLAAVPLLPVTSHWQFYGQSGICIPLPITRNDFSGRNYAFFLMIVLNLALFLTIAAGQVLIYRAIQANSMTCTDDSGRKARERTIESRLLAVVMTDFLCWFPIGVLGLLSECGMAIPGQINVIMAIFVLPFNSALNPFLYTASVVIDCRRNSRKAVTETDRGPTRTNSETDRGPTRTNSEAGNTEDSGPSKEEAFQLFKAFMEDGLLTPEQVRRRVWNIYEG